MSPTPNTIRQGLPRVAGGEPWPPLDIEVVAEVSQPAVAEPMVTEPVASEPVTREAEVSEPAPVHSSRSVRQGLPRVVGGDPWPPSGTVAASAPSSQADEPSESPALTQAPAPAPAPAQVEPVAEPAVATKEDPVAVSTPAASNSDNPAARQGLPRTAGGEPWPPSSFVAAPTVLKPTVAEPVVADTPPVQKANQAATPASAPKPEPTAAATRTPTAEKLAAATTPAPPKPKPDTAKEEPKRLGPLSPKQWVLAGIVGAFAALGLATTVVLIARGITSIDSVAAFIQRYPGEYHLPKSAPVGVPAWLAWNHFFNFFLMVLIIRSGMLVRHQKKPPAYWTSKRSPKVSINLWLHQSLDLLWIINGLVFVVVLFATGHWMRIVPTSWEVFPNALSAALQYLSLDWPTENGWVNYNSLQQIAYFVTVFIAAPLAVISGFRLSAFWPKNPALNKRYPIEVARALHFPTMLYFVLFIIVHVILVFSTGALRNLNHMYAAQGSTDPTQYADNWIGLLYFALSLLVIAGAWVACRPMVLSSIAGVFGKVSSR